jgi:hypothetical protein
MPTDDAYELMKDTLKAVLPSLEECVRMARSTPAKKHLKTHIGQVREALKAAEQTAPPASQSTELVS